MLRPNNYAPMREIRYYVLILLFALATNASRAQKDSDTSTHRFSQAMQATMQDFRKVKSDTTLAVIEGLAKYDTLLKGEIYDYYKFGLAHRKKAFEWNLLSSKITFWVVVILVFTGIIFAGIQFYIALKEKRHRQPSMTTPAPGETYDALKTELVAGARGIKVSSPVLGVIILVISLLFFYLYLAYVYPIQENF
ncbi:MAG: hypothetical protein JST42_29205 [Bacteroidetes bacterium]|nr:hypothetical protein [Bacteroidota bacterium]